ncbi:MAG TPA: universal stress protein [Anaerolineales bacterium]|jgi:nucleotide-binding universal stress UspA family protein
MKTNEPSYRSALNDFNEVRLQASMQEVLARLTGKSNELLSFEDVAHKLKLNVRTEKGLFDIPLNAIVGSVGRYTDFNRSFLPLMGSASERERWARVKAAIDDPSGAGWPPIDVYKVGEVYFVLDGNHRVSVARQEGFTHIQAHVIEVKTDVPLTPDIQPDDLIVKAEYAEFLEQTGFKLLHPEADLSFTVPGQYKRLLEHIEVHRYFMGLDFKRDVSFDEALEHWYENIYLSTIEPLRERGLLRWFPGRTLTDLYLWVSEHRAVLENELGWWARPEAVITELAVQESRQAESDLAATGQWRLARMYDRYTDRLFRDILVPLSGEPESWNALEQALRIAASEPADVHGLHIITARSNEDPGLTLSLQTRFNQACVAAGVKGSLSVEKGEVPELVCQRALLTDLVVLNSAHPPSPGLSSLGSGLRAIIRHSSRPLLAVPGKTSPMDRAMVAFDGSSKSKEAVFVAAYLAERWKLALTVLTVTGDSNSRVQDYVREYLELHEIEADYLLEKGSEDTLLGIIKERGINLVLMGGYSGSPWQEIIIGSAVNLLLRESECPLLICR